MESPRHLLAILSALVISHLLGSCISEYQTPDAGVTDGEHANACNENKKCDYSAFYDPAPMSYHAYFFDYICSGDSLPNIDPEMIPTEGCSLVLVSKYWDGFAEFGCTDHCIDSCWIVHHIDVSTNTAAIWKKYPFEQVPLGGELHPVLSTDWITVEPHEKIYKFDPENGFDWENPPEVILEGVTMVRCTGCSDDLPRKIDLPLQ